MAENVTESAASEAATESSTPATSIPVSADAQAKKNDAVDKAETLQQADANKDVKAEAPGFLELVKQNSTMFLILGGLWLFVIWNMKKNKKRQQERQESLNKINKGDKVVTIGRVHGTVVETDEKTFTIKPDPKKDYTVTFDREALLRVDNRSEGDSSAS